MQTGSLVYIYIFCWSFIISNVNGRPEIINSTFVTEYLKKYGYLAEDNNQTSLNEIGVKNGLLKFQKHVGLQQTGHADTETIRHMNKPRCGVLDIAVDENVLAEMKEIRRWPERKIFYKISHYSRNLRSHEIDQTIKKAFQVWGEVADLRFIERENDKVHIDIKFANGEHGDGRRFDGPLGSVAHAFPPQQGGTHFDDEEHWTLNSQGVNFFQTAVHELGHALGLYHVADRNAIMFDTYDFKNNFTLHHMDIQNIQTLYGPPPIFPRPENSQTPYRDPVIHMNWYINKNLQGEDTNICQKANFDAILRTAEGQTFGFKGKYFYKLLEDAYHTHYNPQTGVLISEYWIGLPGDLDAAVGLKNGSVYFFRADSVWHFYKHRLSPRYPRLISDVFPGIPDDLDAAFTWSGNKQLYFIKDGKYWKFNLDSSYPISSNYPCRVTDMAGIPMMIEAAEELNNRTYFFSGDQYYRLDDHLFQVEKRVQRVNSIRWLGCEQRGESPIEYEDPPYYRHQRKQSEEDPRYLAIPCDCSCRGASSPLLFNSILIDICIFIIFTPKLLLLR